MVPKTERFEMRLDEETLRRVDLWAERDGNGITRSEAMRQLIDLGLRRGSSESAQFSDGERLLLMMVRDLGKHLKVKDPDIDPDLVQDVLVGGHYWAPKHIWHGLYHSYADAPADVEETLNVLTMWDELERSASGLSKKDRARLQTEAPPGFESVRFPGFDGNNEAEHLGIAHFFLKRLKYFSRFSDRELNSHHTTLSTYRKMWPVFKSLREKIMGGGLSVDAIVKVLKAGDGV